MKLNYQTPINTLSYGYCGLNFLKELVKTHEVALFVIGNPEVTNQVDADIVRDAMNRAETFDPTAPNLRIYHQFDMAQSIGRGPRIGFPIFELDQFNALEKHHLSSLDHIIVTSEWGKRVVGANGITVPTSVVPLGVDPEIFFKPSQLRGQANTTFVNVGKWEVRKGHDLLLEAFNEAFEPSDNVDLIMIPTNPFIKDASRWEEMYKSSKLGEKIFIVGRLNNQNDLVKYMLRADCGVFPSHAEGWNLPLMEMMALGKQVIATNYSAHTEFVTPENAMLIKIEQDEVAYDGIWFHGQGNWAGFDDNTKAQLVHYLRLTHEKKERGEDLTNYNGLETVKEFTWEKCGAKLNEVLGAIQ